MGACIDMRPRKNNKNQGRAGRGGGAMRDSKIVKRSNIIDQKEGEWQGEGEQETVSKIERVKKTRRKNRPRMGGDEFTANFRVEENVGTASRGEGPKYVSSFLDGSARVLRVLSSQMVQSEGAEHFEKRVKAYSEVCGLEVMEDQEGSMLIFQDYYCGPTLDLLPSDQMEQFLLQVHDIISALHTMNITLGNLDVFSFRQASEFDPTARLTELNLTGSSEESMGHAHRKDGEKDWEAFGYLVQLALSPQPPIFLPHKVQYVDGSHPVVNDFLKGKRVPREKLVGLPYSSAASSTAAGYQYRKDVMKLIKLRKRRVHHRQIYYPLEFFDSRDRRVSDEMMQRLETLRIFLRIEKYADSIDKNSEEPFIMYCEASDRFKRLKATFVEKDSEAKITELKEALPLLK